MLLVRTQLLIVALVLDVVLGSLAYAQPVGARGQHYGYWPPPYYSQIYPPVPVTAGQFPAYPYGYVPYPGYAPYSGYAPYLPPREERRFDLSDVSPAGKISVRVVPEDSEVSVDGIRLDPSAEKVFEVSLLTGRHRVDVSRPGFAPYSELVEIRRNDNLVIAVTLRPAARTQNRKQSK